ncbi:putative sugar-binding periplasmic protein [Streptomyces sp. MBT84]|jgi:xylobiose transport system substrate-binding protein|uniref:ABC transporter substrate-binding protein n=1 Tax=unclassified Streptomyces TaxID=2593676 RepID=UPI000E245EED|nr:MULTISPECIES: extracellular solute-binding protein [unclassified Streptomyces]MBW8706145.1 putative sugar-binding periplasmic protein [Streptomyces sp. MBT84]MDX3258206.1 extracellular solute-binding protein [Streptomyces sp. MI02-2A]REE58386.1 xylobiose-binding protein [Streptomyces sp. 3212.3]
MKIRARLPRLVAGGATLALALSLSACGSGTGGGSSDDGKIHVLVYGDASNKVEKQIVATFNKTSDVKAVLDTIPGADYQQKLQTIINTPQAPDVFFNWGGGSIQPFVKADLLMPLDDFIKDDPALKSNFLPSVFNSAVVDGKAYGIPMRGTQPVLLFNNGNVLDDAGVQPPKTWDELLSTVKTLKGKGVTPIALGGGDQWPTLMWFEYVYDRVAGPELFEKALGGDKSAWESPESKKALSMLKELVDAGAFGTNFDSVKYTNGASPALVAKGKAAFELMGSWYYAQQQQDAKDFAAKGLGYTTFPAVSGGKGDQADVVGNTNNFYSVLKKTKHPEAVEKFLKLMYSDEFVKAQMAIGNLPTTTNTEKFLDTSASPAYSHFQYDLVKKAPSFQLSWDQAYPPSAITPIHQAVQQFFNGQIDADGFIKAMQALPTE